MTVEKARKILGNSAKNLTNEEIQAIIDCFNGVIEVGLRQFEKRYKVELNIIKLNRINTKKLY